MLDDFLSAVGVSDITKISEPVIYMKANKLLCINNILRVIALEEDTVVLSISKYQNMVIKGIELICKSLSRNEIVLSGKIISVIFEKV